MSKVLPRGANHGRSADDASRPTRWLAGRISPIFVIVGIGLAVAVVGAMWFYLRPAAHPTWTDHELQLMESLWIAKLPPLPPDPSNAVADDPRAARFGHRLFFDPRLSGNGEFACSSCHQPGHRFSDGRLTGAALGESKRNTPSIVGTAYSPWLYWDGRKDSQWSQALSPLEDPNEQGGNRVALARLVTGDTEYRRAYTVLFGTLPELSDPDRFPIAAGPIPGTHLESAWNRMDAADRESITRVFVNIGKAIAAYERLLVPGPSRFDRYVEAISRGDESLAGSILSAEEATGLQLFMDKARCIECHNGPLMTNNEFHNTGIMSAPGEIPDRGRIDGIRLVQDDPFNCLGAYSDNPVKDCAELRFARTGAEVVGALRTQSLRNLQGTAPYSHQGQTPSLEQIMRHYDRAPLALVGHNEAKPLGLNRRERTQLVAFLATLAAPPATAPQWLAPPP
ncbi:MAG: hypothetical protein OXQ29_12880 [Rhodospirillaceae bacterium]|nr:hypothetical protein [Rhodospirillaceae bacterium]